MTSTPLVSVVMAVFNGERFLREAVQSILGQTFSDFEFIIIDDGSTDNSATILESYEKVDARVRVCRQENKGLVASLNRGCGLAQGKYIARMDADDISVQERFAWQVEYMERNPDVGVLGGAVELINANGTALLTRFHAMKDRDIRLAFFQGIVEMCHPTVFMRKEVISFTGGYRPVVTDAEDYDLWLRVADQFQLANLGRVLLRYRIHANQVSLRKRRQQTLSTLAANAAAVSRRNGRPDPLTSIESITPSVLLAFGLSDGAIRTALARYSLAWIRNMSQVGEYPAALELTLEMLRAPDRKHVARWAIAEAHLVLAGLYWRSNRFVESILAVSHAFLTRPLIIGRPIWLLFERCGAPQRGGPLSPSSADDLDPHPSINARTNVH